MEYESNLHKIAINYIKDLFLLDFISILPFFIAFMDTDQDDMRFFKLLRLLRFYKILNELRVTSIFSKILLYFYSDRKLFIQHRVRHVYRTVYFLIITLSMLYTISCMFYLVAFYSKDPITQTGFYYSYNFESQPIWRKTIIVIYFIQTTLATVGYGDFTPQTNSEKVFDIFVMITGIASFSYILNKFQDIIKNNKKRLGYIDYQPDLEEWIIQIGRIAKDPIKKTTAENIQDYYDYYYDNSRLADLNYEDNYFKMMSTPQIQLVY